MNRTIEQWGGIAEHAGNSLLIQAISALQELARQLETERAAWSAKRAELLRNHAAELVRRKTAEGQRNYALNELEFIANTDSIDAVLDPDRAIRVAKAALQSIKEQTK